MKNLTQYYFLFLISQVKILSILPNLVHAELYNAEDAMGMSKCWCNRIRIQNSTLKSVNLGFALVDSELKKGVMECIKKFSLRC